MMDEKTHVEDVDRSFYDFRYEEKDVYRVESGLTPDIIRQISKEKDDPEWMRDFRLHSLEIFERMSMPDWGPSIEGLDMENIVTYVRPNADRMSVTCPVRLSIRVSAISCAAPEQFRMLAVRLS